MIFRVMQWGEFATEKVDTVRKQMLEECKIL